MWRAKHPGPNSGSNVECRLEHPPARAKTKHSNELEGAVHVCACITDRRGRGASTDDGGGEDEGDAHRASRPKAAAVRASVRVLGNWHRSTTERAATDAALAV